ncbi:TadE/TadG family type IV pilus assembly protein [Rhizobium hainanense]|uniref:TadE-like protein n=1 Tax=Rhizobium hainanense TaxID=52131 RepID=A0A1C3W8A1_9HYPH|nr:TadE family protein [Rhizobium hainanense]SCB36111.1 TadE-like protein [Rhizobium hainanense]
MDNEGNAAIEFALITPIFAVILACGVDLALLVYSRFQLEATVSNCASYALIKTEMVDSKNGSDLATKIATMIASEDTAGDTQASVVVNNGAIADYNGAKILVYGRTSQADACYCPKGSGSSLSWGGSQTCGSACPDGGQAGKYVAISVTQAFTPLLSGFGIVSADSVRANAVVRTR